MQVMQVYNTYKILVLFKIPGNYFYPLVSVMIFIITHYLKFCIACIICLVSTLQIVNIKQRVNK